MSEGYTVELGGQTFTQAQWEAVRTYVEGTDAGVLSDAATWTADVTREPTGGQEMREAVARHLAGGSIADWWPAGGLVQQRWLTEADAVLALPELAALIADAERVKRVRELAEEWRYKGEFGVGAWQEGYGPDLEGAVLDSASTDLRRALDGEPQP